MHYLHKILVPLKDHYGNSRFDSVSDKELKDEIRFFAESETEDFYGAVFDWRETETAGRWQCDNSENVILSKNDINTFIKELERCAEYQKTEINNYLKEIKRCSLDLSELVKKHFEGEIIPGFALLKLSNFLYGRYMDDSLFYDLDTYSANVDKRTIQKVKECPDDWALVMFDYHN